MTRIFERTTRLIAASAIALTAVSSGTAQARPQAQQGGQAPETMVVIESEGLASMLTAEKDRHLREALALLPEKVEEFRGSVPDMQGVPRELSDSAFLMLSRPWRMAMTNKGFDQQTGRPGVGIVMSWSMPEEDGRDKAMMIHRAFGQAMAMSGAPMQVRESDAYPNMSAFTVPFMFPLPVDYGPREANDGWRYEIHVGDAPDPDASFDALPVDGAMKAKLRGSVDLASFTPFVNMFAGMAAIAGPQAINAIEDMRASGIIGEDAITIDFFAGELGDRGVSRFAMRGLGIERGQMLGFTDLTVSKSDMRVVPADATFAQIQKMEPQVQWNRLRKQFVSMLSEPRFEELMGQFKNMTGYDLETQVIPSIGNTTSFYLSDSTGGSSFLSSVLLVSLDDPETFHDFWVSLTGLVNGMIGEELAGEPIAIRFSHFEVDGTPVTQIQTPGLPLPFEPTFSVANGWLVAGATPQACHAAVRQVKSPGNGLAGNDAFAGATRGLPAMTSVAFVDSQRTVRDGYPYLTMLGSAVSNMVRPKSPDAPRQPGMVTPLYAEFVKGVKPSVTYTHWDGDDYITEMHADRSLLVNIASILGTGDMGDIASSMLLGGSIGAAIASEADDVVESIDNDWDEDWEDDWGEDHEDHHHDDEHDNEHANSGAH